MSIEERILNSIDTFLNEPDREKVHHVNIVLPGLRCYFWIMDADMLLWERDRLKGQLIIYFSVHNRSRKDKRIVQSVESLNLLQDYLILTDSRSIIYYKGAGQEKEPIAQEIIRIINALFPMLDHDLIEVSILRKDKRMRIEELPG